MRSFLLTLFLFMASPFLFKPALAAESWIDAYKTQCPAQWENQACLSVVSSITGLMVQHYAEALDANGHKDAIDGITQNCAAATAASQGQYPAEAMRSAFTTCANYLVGVADATQVAPDANAYQVLIGAVLCLSGDPRCTAIEEQLQTTP